MLNQSQQLLYHRYKYIQSVGMGSYGQVILVQFQHNLCILKKIDQKDYNTNETDVLKQISHPNIIKLIGVDIRPKKQIVLILTEYCNKGDILKYQRQLPSKVYPLQQALEAFYQILKGLECLHQKNISHRDIKPANIFIKEENSKLVYKIGDFGESSFNALFKSSKIGTVLFEAPEMFMSNFTGEGGEVMETYNKQIDIWSVGVTFFYMLNGKFPFPSESTLEREKDVRKKCQPFRYSKVGGGGMGEGVESLFEKIFVVDPMKRGKVEELILHPVFEKVALGYKATFGGGGTAFDKKLSYEKPENKPHYETKHSLPTPSESPTNTPPNSHISNNSNPSLPSTPSIPSTPTQPSNAQTQAFQILKTKLSHQRQTNNILLYLLTSLQHNHTYFKQQHHLALIYNLLKYYIINHTKLRHQLKSLPLPLYTPFLSSPFYQQFLPLIQHQLSSAYKQFLNQHKKCTAKLQDIMKQFKSSEYKIVISAEIEEKEFGGDFKDFYRLSSSKCYENMKIGMRKKDDREVLVLKFWVLMCHGFNRVCQYHEQVLVKYYEWVERERGGEVGGKEKGKRGLKEGLFREWVENESREGIRETNEKIKNIWFKE